MSSILDALRKVEAEERRRPIRLPPAEPRSRRRLAALVAGAAFVAGAGVVALVVGLRPGALPEPVAETSTPVAETGTEVASAPPVASAPSPPAPAAVAPPAPAPLTPPPAAAAPAAPVPSPPPAASAPSAAPEPAAPVAQAPAEELAAEPVPGETEVDSDVPDQITILRPAAEAPPQAEVQVEALPAPAPAAPPIDVLPGPPAGAPEIHVSFLIYSAAPERRQVSLTIDNGALVTLHEGQRAGSISLVRILRDRIHVEHGGRTFSVRAVL